MAASDDVKLRGGYYTPPQIAEFLAGWAIRDGASAVLEPSCGDGQLVAPAVRRLTRGGRLLGVELFDGEARKAAARGGDRATIVRGDAFAWFRGHRTAGAFDAVVGNPPFIRYQSFPPAYREAALALMREEGLRPNRMTNAWVPFVVLATLALRPGGRLAMVLPAELLQVGYAAELRRYLATRMRTLRLVTFRRLLFRGIQEEVVLVLGERGDGPTCDIDLVELDTAADLAGADLDGGSPVTLRLDHAREKWVRFYLSSRELSLIRELQDAPTVPRLGDFCEVDVGVVTGRNAFFVMSPREAADRGVAEACLPMVGRSAQIPGLVLTGQDWRELYDADARCLLLQLGRRERAELSPAAAAYVAQGERRGLHSGYKCRIRLPRWWAVPSTWVPDAFLLRQIHDGPRLVLNRAGATCTDTIHRVRVKDDRPAAPLAATSMNSMTFAFAEIHGRSYGGGVLELEPTEAEGMPFPAPNGGLALDEVDLWARTKEPAKVLEEVDRVVLRELGLSEGDIRTVRAVWEKLSGRRRQRRAAGR